MMRSVEIWVAEGGQGAAEGPGENGALFYTSMYLSWEECRRDLLVEELAAMNLPQQLITIVHENQVDIPS